MYKMTRKAAYALSLVLLLYNFISLDYYTMKSERVSAEESPKYSWQKPQAKILENGDIEWQPEPFVFKTGSEIRYIDYDNGNDQSDGLTKETAWKHHPWDVNADGEAKLCTGIKTYVFKRGVIYNGQLEAKESGLKGDPIILTSDPDWGVGEALIAGSSRLPAKFIKAETIPKENRPKYLPDDNLDKVWAIDLKELGLANNDLNYEAWGGPQLYELTYIAYRFPNGEKHWGPPGLPFMGVFRVNEDSTISTVNIAQTPDFKESGNDFAMEHWHKWEAPKTLETSTGNRYNVWYDRKWIGYPDDYFLGGSIFTQYASLMGTPSADLITEMTGRNDEDVPFYNSDEGTFAFDKPYGPQANLRYKIVNLPQFLDADDEFYFDPQTCLMYYRPANGEDPNTQRIELTTALRSIDILNKSHIEISNLKFSFAQENTINIEANKGGIVEGINIHHCSFESALLKAIYVQPSRFDGGFVDDITVSDSEFIDVWFTSIEMLDGSGYAYLEEYGRLGEIRIMRNYIYNNGAYPNASIQSSVPAVVVQFPSTVEIAGNVVEKSFGSGIMYFGGKPSGVSGNEFVNTVDYPFNRALIYNNKTEDTALGVNDYGGMSLWQSGSTYAFNNIIGNSPGYMPAGIFGSGYPTSLSYPLYLDGAYKQYSFNNIIWGRSTDPTDVYYNNVQAYFMVYGFLNNFFNNTIYNLGEGMGGSSGARQNIAGNVFADISIDFMRHAHGALPSQIGGGDNNTSNVAGVATLGYDGNIFHGAAVAGSLASKESGADKDIISEDKVDSIAIVQRQMAEFPLRISGFGFRENEIPIIGRKKPDKPIINIKESNVDFRLNGGSKAINGSGTHFVPWSLYGVVGEWDFNKNERDPKEVLDYHWYMSGAHFNRDMYHYIPYNPLLVNEASLEDYIESESEDWVEGGLIFDGSRFASVSDESLKRDVTININQYGNTNELVYIHEFNEYWDVPEPDVSGTIEENPVYSDDAVMTLKGEKRHTMDIKDSNLLVEAIVRIDEDEINNAILGKYDGSSGYRLLVNGEGNAEFEIASGGSHSQVISNITVNDGKWHHIVGELDRESNRLTLYIDGKMSNEVTASLDLGMSLSNSSDFLVGKDYEDGNYLHGAIDFMRVCKGTLEDAKTSIDELYTWQTYGPSKYDFAGVSPVGKRDSGALESKEPYSPSNIVAELNNETGKVDLSWKNNSEYAAGYIIERSETVQFDDYVIVKKITSKDITTFSDGTIAPETAYYYRIRAYTANNEESLASPIIKPFIATNKLLSHENFETYLGENGVVSLHGAITGYGFNGAWTVQNSDEDIPGYNILDTKPLMYKNLKSSPTYAVGGSRYHSNYRSFPLVYNGAYADFLNSTYDLIGVDEKTLYMSFMIRADRTGYDRDFFLALLTSSVPNITDKGKCIVAAGSFSNSHEDGGGENWSLMIRDKVYPSAKPIVVNETALVIVKIEYADVNKVSLYVNPDELNGIEPYTPDVFVETEESVSFKHFGYYGGPGAGNSSISQIRIGDSYKAVTPTVSELIDIYDVRFDENNCLKGIKVGNYTGQTLPAVFIAAMYDRKTNDLIKTELIKNISLEENNFKDIIFERNLYYDSDYTLKIFVWNSLLDITPLSDEVLEY